LYTELHTTIQNSIDHIREVYDEISSEAHEWVEKDLYNRGWDTIFLVDKQKIIRSTRLDPLIDGMINCAFSILRPGCMLKPHRGYDDYADHVWRSHLCLYSSADAGINVNGKDTMFEPGTFFTFDDTQLHYAWNHGKTDRVNFMYDTVRDGHTIKVMR